MGKKRELSAKDMAFEREKIKLHSTIQKQQSEIVRLKTENKELQEHIESLENAVKLLEAKVGIPKEELLANVEREKKIVSFLNTFSFFN